MEKALAREESWGLGDAVNSMAPSARSCPGTGPAKVPSSFPEGDKDRHTARSSRVRSPRGGARSWASPRRPGAPQRPRHCAPQSPGAAEASNRPERTGEEQLRAQPGREQRGAPRDHRLRRWRLGTGVSCAKPRGPLAPPRVLPPSAPRGRPEWPTLQGGGGPGTLGERARTAGARARRGGHCAPALAACALICWRRRSPRPAASQRRRTSPLPDSAAGAGAGPGPGGAGERGAQRPRGLRRSPPQTRHPLGKRVPPPGRRRAPVLPLQPRGGRGCALSGGGVSVPRPKIGEPGVAQGVNLDQRDAGSCCLVQRFP